MGEPIPADIAAAVARRCFGADRGTAPIELRIDAEFPHGNGRKRAATIRRGSASRRIFLKELPPGLTEAGAYAALAAAGAPVATMLASFIRADGGETVVLEHLERVGIAGDDEREFGELVATLARFNAVAADLPAAPRDLPRRWLAALHRAWQRARSGAWGQDAVAAAARVDGAWSRIDAIVDRLIARLDGSPLVATHHDPAYGNVGRVAADSPLLLFDLHYCGRFPRMRDLALCLGGFAQRWPERRGRSWWIERYCEAHNQTARERLEPARAEQEIAVQLALQRCWFDDATLAQAEAAFRADAAGFAAGFGAWLDRTWSALARWARDGDAV